MIRMMNRNSAIAMGRSMKSKGVLTRAMAMRSLASMMPPSTMPMMIGTMGRLRRYRMNPNNPNPAAIRQSVAELRSE